jgi:hypothetical protein
VDKFEYREKHEKGTKQKIIIHHNDRRSKIIF